ncbi:MAG: hypothetical protein MK066_05900 [Crocinitomicaceae bacterium]|nr:hypothetical protein [Crocinitomicaceae bacterium]
MTDHAEQPPKKKGNGGYIAVILLLLLGLAIMGYLWSDKNSELNKCSNDNKRLTTDMTGMNDMMEGYVGNMSNDLKTDFQNMLSTYDALLEKDASQADSINAQKSRIEDLLEQVKRGKMTAHQLFLMRKENETLRGIMKGYVVQIDSLNTLTYQLRSDLETTSTELSSTQSERDELQGIAENQGQQLDKAKKLSAYNFKSMALKSKLGGTMTETNRVRNAKQIVSNFTIGENSVASAGNKVVYMQIVDPSGKTLQSKSSNIVDTENGKIAFSDKRSINYTRSSIDLAIYYDLNTQELQKGNYIVRIYCQGQLIGSDSFTLK